MALEIGQVVSGIVAPPLHRGATPGDTAANAPATPLPGQQAPPLTGVGAKPLSGEALQTLQGTGEAEKSDDGAPGGDLTDEEKDQVRQLKQRDQEVRRHEAAHASVGGQFAGAPSFTYEAGPDGQRYAVGGEVSIDVSPGRTPEETARKADQIRAAALAPADPSGQDRAVAAAAVKMKLDANAEAAKQHQDELKAKQEEAKADAPALPGEKKPETAPEIVGPKPPGQGDTAGAEKPAETGQGSDQAAPQRSATAANAYSRTEAVVSQIGKAAANGLSLVA